MYYEMQGLTWQARKTNQQDAILIAGKVIQHKGVYSKYFCFDAKQSWCVAVADGVSSHHYSGRAAKSVLKSVQEYYADHEQDIRFSYIQQQLCTTLDNIDFDWEDDNEPVQAVTHGASTTLALLRHSMQDADNEVKIQSLGDSRVYVFRQQTKQWQSLTEDDNFINELVNSDELSNAELAAKYEMGEKELASMYYVLTGFFSADSLHEVPEKQTLTHKAQNGDVFLVCTDGVYDAVPHEDWQAAPSTEQTLKEWLEFFLKSLSPTAGDNISLIVIRVTEEDV